MLPLPTLTAYQESLQRACTAIAQHEQMTASLASMLGAELTGINQMVIAAQQSQQPAAPATPPAPPPPPVWNPATNQWDVQQPAAPPAPPAPPAPQAAPAGAPLGYPPPAHMQTPSFPATSAAAPAAPAAPATAPAAAGSRKRRTKVQIAADEAAIARGFLSADDETAKLAMGAGNAPGGAAGAGPAPVSAPVVAGAGTPVQPMPGAAVPGNVPAASPLAKGAEDVQAAYLKLVQTVEKVWPGHGEGQAAQVFTGVFPGIPNLHSLPTEQSQKLAIQWAEHFIAQFVGQKLPQGAATPGFLPNTAPA